MSNDRSRAPFASGAFSSKTRLRDEGLEETLRQAQEQLSEVMRLLTEGDQPQTEQRRTSSRAKRDRALGRTSLAEVVARILLFVGDELQTHGRLLSRSLSVVRHGFKRGTGVGASVRSALQVILDAQERIDEAISLLEGGSPSKFAPRGFALRRQAEAGRAARRPFQHPRSSGLAEFLSARRTEGGPAQAATVLEAVGSHLRQQGMWLMSSRHGADPALRELVGEGSEVFWLRMADAERRPQGKTEQMPEHRAKENSALADLERFRAEYAMDYERAGRVSDHTQAKSDAARRGWVEDGLLVPARELAQAWGRTERELEQACERDELFRVKAGERWWYPSAFKDLSPADVAKVCRALAGADSVSKFLFWQRRHGGLAGRSLAAALKEGQVRRAQEIALAYVEENGWRALDASHA